MVERIRPKRTFEVGYARPPKATQFKAGKSGNARGRPKGARGIAAILSQLLRQKIVVTENGRKRRVRRVEVIMHRLVNDALLGDPRALKFLFPLIERYRRIARGRAALGGDARGGSGNPGNIFEEACRHLPGTDQTNLAKMVGAHDI